MLSGLDSLNIFANNNIMASRSRVTRHVSRNYDILGNHFQITTNVQWDGRVFVTCSVFSRLHGKLFIERISFVFSYIRQAQFF